MPRDPELRRGVTRDSGGVRGRTDTPGYPGMAPNLHPIVTASATRRWTPNPGAIGKVAAPARRTRETAVCRCEIGVLIMSGEVQLWAAAREQQAPRPGLVLWPGQANRFHASIVAHGGRTLALYREGATGALVRLFGLGRVVDLIDP